MHAYGIYVDYAIFNDYVIFYDSAVFVVFAVSNACRILQTTIKPGSADQTSIQEQAYFTQAMK